MYIISIPFYLIKNVGYLEAAGLLLIGIYVIYFSKNPKEGLFRLVILLITPVIYFVLAVRSEIFFIATIMIGVLFLAEKYSAGEKLDIKFFIAAVVTGLVLSTDAVSFFIFIIYSIYAFRNDAKRLILFVMTSLTVFALTLLPFYAWNPETFLSSGPFAAVSFISQIPGWAIAVWLIFSVYAGWGASNLRDVFFASGLILFFPALFIMMEKIGSFGFYRALVQDGFDPSYFIFCVPFFILSISDYRTDKFLNRIDPG